MSEKEGHQVKKSDGNAARTPSMTQQTRRAAGPVTGRGEARKLVLLAAARRVFERKGFFDTRIADIVAEARVAQGTFYTYFDSKDSIFEAVARSVVGDMLAALHPRRSMSTDEPYDRVYAAMERFVDAYRPNARWVALIEQVGTYTPELQRLRLQVREAFVDRAARGIRHQQESGVADPTIDPVMTSEMLGAMVDHVCYIWLNLGKEFDEHTLLATLTNVWARAVGLPIPESAKQTGDGLAAELNPS